MSLIKDLQEQTVVILAQGLKPSAFNQHWFIKNEIIKDESEISPNSIFTPDITKISASKFQVIVTPNQIQIAPSRDIDLQDCITNILVPILNKIENVLFSAIGLNWGWFVYDSDHSFQKFNKQFFFKDSFPLYSYFDQADARFGTYMSKSFLDSRLRLDVRPIRISDEKSHQNEKEFLFFRFNFHTDLTQDNKLSQLLEILSKWNEYSNEANSIINSI